MTAPMPSPSTTEAVRGWALLADRSTPGPARMLERHGIVYRHPLPVSATVAMVPGQPCVLLQLDRSKVVGLWAVGEVVAEPLRLPAGFAWTPAERPLLADPPDGAEGAAPPERCWAEVELLALEKPLALDRLAAHRDLADSALVRSDRRPPVPGPVPLTASQVRAIESFDTWLVEPEPDRRRALDDLLAAEEQLLP